MTRTHWVAPATENQSRAENKCLDSLKMDDHYFLRRVKNFPIPTRRTRPAGSLIRSNMRLPSRKLGLYRVGQKSKPM